MENRLDTGIIYRTEETKDGSLRFWMGVSKVGPLVYLDEKGQERVEYVSKETLFDKASLDTTWGKPITLMHPESGLLDRTNTRQHQRGMTQLYRDDSRPDILTLLGVLNDAEAIEAVRSGDAVEVSAGYRCDVVQVGDRLEQRNREYNHFAIVPKGRAGSEVKVHLDCFRCDSAVTRQDFETIGEPATQAAAIATEKKQSNNRTDEGGAMPRINLDGVDYEFKSDEIAAIKAELANQREAAIAPLQEKFDSLSAKEDDAGKLKAKLDEAETQVQTLTGEVQGLKTKMEELTTSDEAIAAEVQARNDAWSEVLPSIKSVDSNFRIDSALTVPQIKRAYLKTVRKQDGVDDLPDAVIDGMYLALKPDAKQDAADKTRSHLDQLDNVERRDGSDYGKKKTEMVNRRKGRNLPGLEVVK